MKIFLLMLALMTACARAITFEDWVASYSLTGDDAAEDADPDGDSFSNLLEYALEGLDPTVPTSGAHPSLPRMGYVRRTGSAEGQWEFASFSAPPTNGLNGVYHLALLYTARPDAVDILYRPMVSKNLRRWHCGRCAFRTELLPGNVLMSVHLARGNRHDRQFLKLKVQLKPGLGDALAGAHVGGLTAQTLELSGPSSTPRVLSGGTAEELDVDDIRVLRTTGATSGTDYTWTWWPGQYNLKPVTVSRASSNDAVITPDTVNPFLWRYVAPGTATLQLSTETATYQASVTTSTAGGATVDAYLGTKTGTLRAALETAVDSRIAGKTAAAKLIYSTQDHAGGVYVRNAGCWAASVDLTPLSPWNSTGGNHMAGILVSPRHVIFATHYMPAVGATIRFVQADNTVVTRTITGMQSLTTTANLYPDLSVGLLNEAVPEDIGFAKVLPDDWLNYLPTLATRPVPLLCLDQEEKALISEMPPAATSPVARIFMQVPADAQRAVFHEAMIGGDSGNPACMIVDNELVLITVWTGGGAGVGTPVVSFKTALNSAMTTLGGGHSLTDADLSGYEDFTP